jgi:ATP-binding cassette subfamily F protein 3
MISLNNLRLRFGDREILRGVDLTINDGECVAVVGPNGCGKTTLLKVIAGLENPEQGDVSVPNRATIGYLPQQADLDTDTTLQEELLDAFSEVREALAEMKSLEKEMGRTDPDSPEHDRVLQKYTEKAHFVEMRDGYALEPQVRRIGTGLGFTEEDFGRSCREFSGGWQMRILLAKLLLRCPDILLLDEPTNHLDLESTLWLENWILDCGQTVALVSHERATMDRLADRIVCMEQGKAEVYPGDYSKYLAQSAQKREAAWAAYERQKKEIETIEAFIRRFRYNARRASLVQSRVKQLDKIKRLEPPFHPTAIHFDFPAAPPSYREVAILENLGHAYGDNRVFSGVGLTIRRGEKIGLVGINGAGKSTLLRILAGREQPTEGECRIGGKVERAYFAQYDTSTLDSATTLLQAVESAAPMGQASRARDLLGAFLFSGNEVTKPLKVLSGGERTRFRLAQMLFSPANLLLLDEPTNHLDVTSRATVEKALHNYTGTVVVVSHDRVFMDRVTNRIIEIESGSIHDYPGRYSDYLADREGEYGRVSGADDEPRDFTHLEKSLTKEERIREHRDRKAHSRKIEVLERKVREAEESIERVETQISELDKMLADPEISSDYERLASISGERKEAEKEQSRFLQDWERFHQELEDLRPEN